MYSHEYETSLIDDPKSPDFALTTGKLNLVPSYIIRCRSFSLLQKSFTFLVRYGKNHVLQGEFKLKTAREMAHKRCLSKFYQIPNDD